MLLMPDQKCLLVQRHDVVVEAEDCHWPGPTHKKGLARGCSLIPSKAPTEAWERTLLVSQVPWAGAWCSFERGLACAKEAHECPNGLPFTGRGRADDLSKFSKRSAATVQCSGGLAAVRRYQSRGAITSSMSTSAKP